MRTLAITLGLLALAFAGCSDDPSDDGPNGTETASPTSTASLSATGSKTSTSTGSASQTGTSAANQPPVGAVTATANGTTVSFNLTGSDPDGDALTWTLTFSDGAAANGTALPAALDHTYAAAGDVGANFTVSDGKDNASYVVNVTLTAGPKPGPVVHAGSVAVPDPWAAVLNGCLMDAGRRDAGGPDGVTGQDHAVEQAQWGWSYALDNAGLIAEYWSADAILGAGNAGTVPEQATYVVVCIKDPEAAPADYQLTLTPP